MKYWRYPFFLTQEYGLTSRFLDPLFIARNTGALRNPLLPCFPLFSSCFLLFLNKPANQNGQVGSTSICLKQSKNYFHKCKGLSKGRCYEEVA